MTRPTTERCIATGRVITQPAGTVQKVILPMPKPAIVILVHGVNDVGEAYVEQETGICLGMSERLDRTGRQESLLSGAYYRVPDCADRDAPDPDAVYFRRSHTQARLPPRGQDALEPRSVVIPFYWGFREEEGINPKTGKPWIDKHQPHGEYLDRHGNRLDKDSAKNGGPFANATSCIPDMWADGFSGRIAKVVPSNPVGGTATRPLLKARSRHYMVLAAQRLAMLVRMIRRKNPDDTINVVGHSQGCLVSLLANALLKDSGDRPVDTLVMNHPPYGLGEPLLDNMESGNDQQTVEARVKTLQSIIGFMTGTAHATPAFSALADAPRGKVVGRGWGPHQAQRASVGQGGSAFNERDNRGKVYLYFCPDDQTVALQTVQGIGWAGVPDKIEVLTTERYQSREANRASDHGHGYEQKMQVLDTLGPRFKQRCFTKRVRAGESLKVGLPPHDYLLEKWHEWTWTGTTMGAKDKLGRGGFSTGQTVRVTGEALTPPVTPQLGGDMDAISPIDASIAMTQDEGLLLPWEMFPRLVHSTGTHAVRNIGLIPAEAVPDLERAWNEGKATVDKAKVVHARHLGGGRVEIRRKETPAEVKRRWMDTTDSEDNRKSFHSSIVANAMHSQKVTAYDLSIGQARTIDDRTYYLYLCLVADWRTPWDERKKIAPTTDQVEVEMALDLYKREGAKFPLIAQTLHYRNTGILPDCAKCELPTLVWTQTADDRKRYQPVRQGAGA
ncbi:effector protein Tle3 domain-containing protein [Stenotrophomonas maltophilia]